MKVAIEAASAKIGGGATYIANLLRCLPPPGSSMEFDVFLPPETSDGQAELPSNIHLIRTLVGYAGWWKRIWWGQITLRRLVKKHQADILYSTGNFGMMCCPVRQILLVSNALYFSTFYQQEMLGRHSLGYRVAFRLRRWLIGRSVRDADVVMTPSQATLDDLRRYVAVPPQKSLVNAFGAERWEGQAEGNHGAAQRDAADKPVRLLYVSLYAEHKNLNTLLKAMPLLNQNGDQRFTLTTTANPAWEGSLWTVTHREDRQLLQRPEVGGAVQFVGPLGKPETQQLYRGADIVVFPSLIESFGFPMVEAMVNGLPMVVADTPVNREICGEAPLYFRPLDPEDLAEKVKLLGRDQALREKLGARGRRRAADFRWENHVERLLKAVGSPTAREAVGNPTAREAGGVL